MTIGIGGPAIALTSAGSGAAFDTIMIGQTGVLRSIAGDALVLTRSNETVINHGSIMANPSSGNRRSPATTRFDQCRHDHRRYRHFHDRHQQFADQFGRDQRADRSGPRRRHHLAGPTPAALRPRISNPSCKAGSPRQGFTTPAASLSASVAMVAFRPAPPAPPASYELTNLGRIHAAAAGLGSRWAMRPQPTPVPPVGDQQWPDHWRAWRHSGDRQHGLLRDDHQHRNRDDRDGQRQPRIAFSGTLLRLVQSGSNDLFRRWSGVFDDATIQATGANSSLRP